MTTTRRGRYASTLGLLATCLLAANVCSTARAYKKPPQPVEALLYSTMPSTNEHSPEMAFDGDPATYFKTVYGMGEGDTFLVLLSQPVSIRSLRITTGDTEGQDILTEGSVETSEDTLSFRKAGTFDSQGVALVKPGRKAIRAFRIRVDRRRAIAHLIVRDIAIESRVKVGHFQRGPGRGFADLSQAPDLTAWAQKAEQQMESFWPDAAALLYSQNFITPNMVQVIYRTGPRVTPVAATGGGVMEVNSEWCRKHPEDTGLTVHEMAHVVQSISAYNPVWLIEGVADYIRWIRFEPQNYQTRINPKTATYHDSYRTTGSFLAWCELHYDNRLVTKLNDDVRFGRYSNEKFKEYCGKDVDTLWSEFIAAYQADPTHITTPVIPQADRPRSLPTVKPGSSVFVDLSTAFNQTGFYKDGAHFGEASGFDGGGSAYSAALLGAEPNSKGVAFHVGNADAANIVSCQGNVIALPAGSFGSLWLLGAAVEGSQRAQPLTVTYTDGTTETLSQSFSDWYEPQNFPGELRAVKMEYRNIGDGSKDPRPFYAYSYYFGLNNSKTVKSLTLPNNPNIKILALSLAN